MTRMPLIAAVAISTGVAVPAQDSLSAAWLVEHLRRPAGAPRAPYERLISAGRPEDPDGRAIALARLAELDRVLGDGQALRRHAAELRELLDARSPAGLEPLELGQGALTAALAMPAGPARDLALEVARKRLAEALDALPGPPPSIVGQVARRLMAERDAGRQQLRRELEQASARGDHRRVQSLRARLAPGADGGTAARARAARIRVLRALTLGRFGVAAELVTRLREHDASPGESPSIEQLLARQDLHPRERLALEALVRRLRRWDAQGAPEAARALSLLPY